jgi:hypothetical protein
MTQEQFAAAISPSVDRARGLCEVFYQRKPFADDNNPTRADVDEWHRIAINHVRALVAYASEERQVKKDHCMFARALWGDERKYTTLWDAKYPGTVGSASGPCQASANAHCGATFLPSLQDQAPYLPGGHPGRSADEGAEGVLSGTVRRVSSRSCRRSTRTRSECHAVHPFGRPVSSAAAQAASGGLPRECTGP